MVIIELKLDLGKSIILKLYKSILREIVNRYYKSSTVIEVIKTFGDRSIDRAIESIYMTDGIIYTPEGDINCKVLRTLEYGNGYIKGFAPLSQAADSLKERLGDPYDI